VFNGEDLILVENIYKLKSYGAKKLICGFSDKGWNVNGLNEPKKLLDTSSTARQCVQC